MNRVDRLAAILVMLQSRRVLRAADIAARFGISLRTVYRDIRTLENGGVPIIGEAGVGYALAQGYRLAPILFTTDEAFALLTAEKLVAQLTDPATAAHIGRALDKIRAVLAESEKAVLDQLDARIKVLPSRARRLEPSTPSWLPLILRSASTRRAVRFQYFSAYRNASGPRVAEPLGVFFQEGFWHLIGYCLDRQAYRDFRLDRISELVLTDQPFAHHHPPLADYLQREWHNPANQPLEQVIIRVNPTEARYLENQKFFYGFTHETVTETYLEMHFLVFTLEGFVRWFATFADCATIVSPPQAAERLRTYVATLAARYP